MKKMKKFIILCRYECWGENGKEWTKWFIVDSKPRSLEDAEKRITELKANSAHTAKITKLNYEYTTRSLWTSLYKESVIFNTFFFYIKIKN